MTVSWFYPFGIGQKFHAMHYDAQLENSKAIHAYSCVRQIALRLPGMSERYLLVFKIIASNLSRVATEDA